MFSQSSLFAQYLISFGADFLSCRSWTHESYINLFMWQHNISGSLSPAFTLLLPSSPSDRWPSLRFLSQRRDVTARGRERRVSSRLLVPETALRRK